MLKKILSRKTVIASLVSLAVLALGGGIWYIMIDRGFSLTDNPAQTVSISEVRAPEESLVYDDKITPLSLAVIFDKPAARMDLVGIFSKSPFNCSRSIYLSLSTVMPSIQIL